MTAARLLRPTSALTAAVACSSLYGFSRARRRTCLDTPGTVRWPQDVHLVSDARRSLEVDAKTHPSSPKKGDAEIIDEANPPDSYIPAFEDDDDAAWGTFSRNFNIVVDSTKTAFDGFVWSSIGEKITDFVLPGWGRNIPLLIDKLQFELSMEPGSLADEIWKESHDPAINPEILWDARVRVSTDLCSEEMDFRRNRKRHLVQALARYLDVAESDVHPEDVPTIAMCGSGGGLRALIAGSSSYLSAQEAGLYDIVTYTAGVSGSCWLQSLYFSSLGKQHYPTLIHHLKNRCGTHIAFPPPALKLVTSAPTNKFLLSGWVEKLKGDPGGSWGLVDVYSLLLAARYLVPHGDLDVQDRDLKLSNQRAYLDGPSAGMHPMPIYTAVRHEIPIAEVAEEADRRDETIKERVKEKAKQEAWFSWFEMTPYEIFCEDFGAGIPTWSLGRPFKDGRGMRLDTGVALPELRQSLLLGIWASAFTATLSHYRHELQLAGLAGFDPLNNLLDERQDDLAKIHPIEPATIPNFVCGMKDQLPQTCPESVFETDHLQLMDAGMSNNLPIYPLLRPGRDIDVVIAFDASADIQTENWLSVVDGYAKQRGIKSWPAGTGFPKASSKGAETVKILEEAESSTAQEAAGKVAEAREKSRKSSPKNEPAEQDGGATPVSESALGHCTVWVGTKQERTSEQKPPASRRLAWDDPDDSTFHLMEPDAGIAVVYFPLLPNEKVENVDPDRTDFMSTWNFIYTPEQIDKVVALAKANFEEGADQTKRTIRAVYERKKKMRLEREGKNRIKFWKRKLRDASDHFQ